LTTQRSLLWRSEWDCWSCNNFIGLEKSRIGYDTSTELEIVFDSSEEKIFNITTLIHLVIQNKIPDSIAKVKNILRR
jgi:hypothetical protein